MPIWCVGNSFTGRIADDGASDWSTTFYSQQAVAVRPDETSIFAGTRSGGITHRTYNAAGTEGWTGDHGVRLYSVAYDPSGNIYIAGEEDGSGYHYRKLNADGSVIYSIAGSGTCFAISARGGDSMYVGLVGVLRRRDPESTSPTPTWSFNHGEQINAIVEDADGNVYIGGNRSGSVSVRKIDPDGDLVWDFDTGGNVRALAIDDANSHLYAVGARVGTATAWKLNFSGTEITTGWPTDHGNGLLAVAVGADGSVYVAGTRTSDVSTRKYQPNGTEVTSGNWPLNQSSLIYGLAYAAILQSEPPGLALPFALGAPIWAYTHSPAGLLLPVALGLPGLSTPPVPPAPDPALRTVYRLYLSDPDGGSDLLELPLAALQCTRRVNESTWIALAVPAVTDARLAAIKARVQGQIVIYAGVATPSGETLGEFLRATLTEVSIARDGNASGATLTARVIPTPFTAGSYVLQGVSERGADAGRRVVVCAVDPRIRPNDTVDDGVSSWTAGIIAYRIDPTTAAMRITEAL
jgi:hypothetical protein